MREFSLLKHIYDANSRLPVAVSIPPGDDMALVALGDKRLLAAVDQLVDGRHVRVDRTPIELVGRKAITRSLSDIAAMAGTPVATLVAATLPPNFGETRTVALFEAMRKTCEQYECPLIGGDIAMHSSGDHPLVCSVTVLAIPSGNRAITRGGARVGDIVAVTGPLGGSLNADGLGRHLTFEPRIDLARKILEHCGDRLHAMIDISDGLGRDASHIAQMSRVQIVLEANRIPCNANCDWRRAMTDGEDYELCMTLAPPLDSEMEATGLVQVGIVRARPSESAPWVVVSVGDELIDADELGWQHAS